MAIRNTNVMETDGGLTTATSNTASQIAQNPPTAQQTAEQRALLSQQAEAEKLQNQTIDNRINVAAEQQRAMRDAQQRLIPQQGGSISGASGYPSMPTMPSSPQYQPQPSQQVSIPQSTTQRIEIPSQEIKIPTAKITMPKIERTPSEVQLPGANINVTGPAPIDWDSTEVASLYDSARAISSEIGQKANLHSERINSMLQDLAQPNEYMQQVMNMNFEYDPMADQEYVRASTQLENQIMQMMVGRGGLYSSVAQATLQASMIDMQVAFRGQRHNEFINDRNFMLQAAQMEQQRRSDLFNQTIQSASFDIETMRDEYSRLTDIADRERSLLSEQWEQQYKAAQMEYQKQVDEFRQQMDVAAFQEGQRQQEFENNVTMAQMEYAAQVDQYDRQFRVYQAQVQEQQRQIENQVMLAEFEARKQQQQWENQYKLMMYNSQEEARRWSQQIDRFNMEMQQYEASLANMQIQAAREQEQMFTQVADEQARTTQMQNRFERLYDDWAETGRASNEVAQFFGVSPGTSFGSSYSSKAIEGISRQIETLVNTHTENMNYVYERQSTLFELDNIYEINKAMAEESMNQNQPQAPFEQQKTITYNTNPNALVPPTEEGDRMLSEYYKIENSITTDNAYNKYNSLVGNSGYYINKMGTSLYERLKIEAQTRMRIAYDQARNVGNASNDIDIMSFLEDDTSSTTNERESDLSRNTNRSIFTQ